MKLIRIGNTAYNTFSFPAVRRNYDRELALIDDGLTAKPIDLEIFHFQSLLDLQTRIRKLHILERK